MANWANIASLGDPKDPDWQSKNLVWIEPVPGQRWQVYAPAAPAFEGLLKDLAAKGYTPTTSGGFNYRNIRGSNKLSQHAFGTAIDMNSMTNQRGQKVSDIPDADKLAKKWGLEWGGNWRNPDPMHFEYKGQSPGRDVQVASVQKAPEVPGLSTGVGLTSTPQTGAATPTQVANAAPPSTGILGMKPGIIDAFNKGGIKGALASLGGEGGGGDVLGGLGDLLGAAGGQKQAPAAPAVQPGQALAAAEQGDAARMQMASQMFAQLLNKKKTNPYSGGFGLTLGA